MHLGKNTLLLLCFAFMASTQRSPQKFVQENQRIQQERQDRINSYLRIYQNTILKDEGSLLWDVIDNRPTYIKNYNARAAKSTRTLFLAPNGGLGLDLGGKSLNIGVWKVGGIPQLDHPELVMNDGRIFTSTNANNVVTGGLFSVHLF